MGTEDGGISVRQDTFKVCAVAYTCYSLAFPGVPCFRKDSLYRFRECFMVNADNFVVLEYRVLKDRGVCKDSLVWEAGEEDVH